MYSSWDEMEIKLIFIAYVVFILVFGGLTAIICHVYNKKRNKKLLPAKIFFIIDFIFALFSGIVVWIIISLTKSFGIALTLGVIWYVIAEPVMCILLILSAVLWIANAIETRHKKRILTNIEEVQNISYQEDIINDNQLNNLVNQFENKGEE